MAARRNRRGRRRNRGRFSALYKLLSVLIIFAAILMGCVVFFRVSTVEITGDSPYTEEEIRRLLSNETAGNEDYVSIGVTNVNTRLVLNYGDECALKIRSEVGKYTETVLRMPAETKEGHI